MSSSMAATPTSGSSTSLTDTASAIYFFSRLAHFLVYSAGIPVLRTLAFFGGWGATAVLILRLAGLA